MVNQPKKILFITQSEYGQSNVHLAVAYEAALKEDVEVHIASFAPLKSRVTELQERISHKTAGKKTVTFHIIEGQAQLEALGDDILKDFSQGPGFQNAVASYAGIPKILLTWDIAEYIRMYERVVKIIEAVDPVIVAQDNLHIAGLDACRNLGRNHVILSPNTPKEFVNSLQPNLAGFWKYPAVSSGYPFPVPYHLIPVNIYLMIRLIFTLVRSPEFKEMNQRRKDYGLKGEFPALEVYKKDCHYIVPSTPEIDFPYFVPSNFTHCGPISLPIIPLSESDPELALWLDRAPTVLINLGSHFKSDWVPGFGRELATALRILLDRRSDIQVLWKLKMSKSENGHDDISEILAEETKSRRVRIESWLKPDTPAILQSGKVACWVHHGGSNSYHEAIGAGVPQIILPMWLDLYDFAERAEYLGVGLMGNRRAAPTVDPVELSDVLLTVVGQEGKEETSIAMRDRAKVLAKIAQQKGGRGLACEAILSRIGDSH
ncbi:MAG: hypothetical protein M1812_006629 [Candelaria pacifica]|nr:MAG: hypothetical protein M1812_006629 [Candelaria pacifica]